MKSKIIKSILIPTLGMLSTGVVTPMVLSSCLTTVLVQSISINKKSLTLSLNESEKLTATVLPENATNKNVSWSSSNNEVATVDKNGKVTAVGIGEATITVTTVDSEHTATCEVNVADKVIHVQSISLNKKSLTLGLNEFEQLTATVLPENATNKNVSWSSSNNEVATVDKNGLVTAVGIGETTITVTTDDGEHTATCEVNVADKVIHVQSISINKKSLTLSLNESEKLTATVLPENATNKNVSWNSSNGEVATVDKNGLVTAVGIGETTITVTTDDGEHTATCEVNVLSDLITINANSDSTLELINKNNNPNLQYSTDQENWNEYTNNIEISKDTKLYLKGNNPNGWSFRDNRYSSLIFTGNVSVSGNVMGLLDNGAKSKEQSDIADIPCDYCFYNLFNKSNGVCEISNDFLPATELADYCYDSMFTGCSSLTKAPDLPAINLAKGCYANLFSDCSSLTKTPDLPAIKLAELCYYSMFSYCSSLINAPDLPAIKLAELCYNFMFEYCSSLTEAPDLPATELADYCYKSMFHGCESLENAPDLPATVLANECYYDMFYNCSSLTSIKIYYEGSYDSSYFSDWVNNVADNGTFYYNGTDWITNFGFPSNWTKQSFPK